eukprot:48543-Chlamydomonas_euryale.AAC.4
MQTELEYICTHGRREGASRTRSGSGRFGIRVEGPRRRSGSGLWVLIGRRKVALVASPAAGV